VRSLRAKRSDLLTSRAHAVRNRRSEKTVVSAANR